MHRDPLLALLAAYVPADGADAVTRDQIVQFVEDQPDCFCRHLWAGHITGATWLLDSTGQRVLLTHHKKLNRWLQPGGHADGDPDILAVALNEAHEETGLEGIRLVKEGIFDLDIHSIPARGEVPQHLHYDIRFLVQTSESEDFVVSDESHALAWFSGEELIRKDLDESIQRMHRKHLRHVTASHK